jgi:UDP-N-acetylmuramoyl-L-alanyl-D-glutamate--2,6-diaminopimelate ligase
MHFEVAGFTNLSRDHLDDFGTMIDYLSAKRELFTNKFSDSAVISVEDDFAKQLLEGLKIAGVGIGDGLQYQLQKTDHGFKITGKQNLELNLEIGPLMAKNLALAVIMLLEAGFDARELTSAAEAMEIQVPGRLELVGPGLPHVYVDYAHTPAAIDAAGRELKSKYPELTIVFGASGDRDPGKRSDMAAAAAKYGDILVVTDQHPRSEDPALIRKTLMDAALKKTDPDRIFEVADPAEAIAKAVNITARGGAILWCGPGHLTYREVMGQKLPFDAIAVAREALES